MNMLFPFARKRTAVALAVALWAPVAPVLMTGMAHAQTDAAAARQYDIPAGSLTQVLNQFSQRAGVTLSFDPSFTAGKSSAGLKGSHTVQSGFNAVLQNSGLKARPSGTGYTLQRIPVTGNAAVTETAATALAEIHVTAATDSLTTEGTGSYAAKATSTATGLPLSLRETPQSVTVVTRQQMEDQGMVQLTDALKQVPGISFDQLGSPGTDGNSVYSRGFAVENYQVDGVPQFNSWLLQTADLAVYDRVEVLRGATGLMNGAGTPAATINLVRKRPTEVFQANAGVTLGSWDFKRTDIDVSGPLTEQGNVRGRVVVALQDNDSFINNLTERKEIFYGVLDVDLTRDTKLTLGVNYQKHNADAQGRSGMPLYYADGSLTDFPRSLNSGANWAHSHQLHRDGFMELEHQFDNEWMLKANLSQTRRRFDDVIGYMYPFPFGTWNMQQDGSGFSLIANKWKSEYAQNALDLHASGPFELFGRKHDLVVGYNLSRAKYDAPWFDGWQGLPITNLNTWDGNTPAEPAWNILGMDNFSETQSGLYSTARFRATDQLSVLVGARVSNWKQSVVGTPLGGAGTLTSREENGVVTPYLGVVYDITKQWSVYASYTDIFKAQSEKTVTGDYIDPLTGTNTEIGAKSALLDGRLNFSVALFEVNQDNLAVQDGGNLAPDGSTAYRAAQGAKTTGYELEVSGSPMRDWNISGGYTQRTSKDAGGLSLNTESPSNMFKLFTTYRLAGIGNGLTLGGGARWQGAIYADGMGPNGVRFTQDAYTVVDLMARYLISKDLALTANLNNVFDKSYYTTVYSAYYGTPRNLRVSLNYKF